MEFLQIFISSWQNIDVLNWLILLFASAMLGMIVGAIPGIGTSVAISVCLPFLFKLDLFYSLSALGAIYYGVQYSGAIPSILLNIPGAPPAAISCIEGHKMAKNGRAKPALYMSALASFAGSLIGIILMLLLTKPIAQVAIAFGPSEYFALMFFTMIAVAAIQDGSVAKHLFMICFGIMLGMVGTDINTGFPRFHMGITSLRSGIDLTVLLIGIFAVGEILYQYDANKNQIITSKCMHAFNKISLKLQDIKDSFWPSMRGTGIGSYFGALPGTGPTISAFVAYMAEKIFFDKSKKFQSNKGTISGLVAPEAANNAAVQTSWIPTLSIGIPGDSVMIFVLSIFYAKGIIVGPTLIQNNESLLWLLSFSFLIGNMVCLAINVSCLKILTKIALVPFKFIFSTVIVFAMLGAYSLENSLQDVLMLGMFGLLGYLMKIFKFDAVSFLIGFILGPGIELYLRRGLDMYQGNYFIFFTNSFLSIFFITAALLVLIFAIYKKIR